MDEEFQGAVCGGKWWNPPRNMFSGGLSSPCSVAQLGGGGAGYDMADFGWSSHHHESIKGKPHIIHENNNVENKNNNTLVYDNSMGFSSDIDLSLDIFGFGSSIAPASSTTDWNNQYHMSSEDGGHEGNFNSNLQNEVIADDAFSCSVSSGLCYGMGTTSSPPMALTVSSNNSGDSSTVTCEAGLNTSYPMSSSASYLIQSLFDDTNNDSQLIMNNTNYGVLNPNNELISPNINSPQLDMMINNGQGSDNRYSSATTLSNIQASLLNSLQSRSRASSLNHKSQSCANNNIGPKANNKVQVRESKRNNASEKPQSNKKPRIETPSSLPTFKVRKEKLGDRITALQQLVSPFGKTDTASVLHEAIEYIKFLHDQVNTLSTPYLKNNGAAIQQQQGSDVSNDNESGQDLRNRGLCLVPISITYPVAQETPVDFWTPTFGGTTFT